MQQELCENANICYICKEKFENKYLKNKEYGKVRYHCDYTGEYRDAAYRICNSKYSVPKKSPIACHNGSNYDYDFTIKWLTDKFKTKFTCLGENTEKYINFIVLTEKKLQQLKKMEKKLQKTYLTYSNLLIVEVYGKLIIKSCQWSFWRNS